MSFLELKKVTKVYPNGTKAVQPTSLKIEKGEFMVFVGPSGCGKSTLLRMVAGLEDITTGDIKLDKKIINKIDPSERDVAMVFQNYALYPHMNVYNNLAYGLKNRGLAKDVIEKKVKAAAKLLQISDYLERRPALLSGGQRQRVAMGRAIVRSPKIFLFDEPLSNLDAKLRIQMRLEIKKLQRKVGVTSIFVTHDQVEAMTLADRLAVINNGIIEQLGTPIEIYNNPKYPDEYEVTIKEDFETGSGTIRNSGQIVFNTALLDWGWVSGIAICDAQYVNTDESNSPGNVLMHAALDNPRIIYAGDNVKFDYNKIEISFK